MTDIREMMARSMVSDASGCPFQATPANEVERINLEMRRAYWRNLADRAVEAINEAGYALVPRESNERMENAALPIAEECHRVGECLDAVDIANIWRGMREAGEVKP